MGRFLLLVLGYIGESGFDLAEVLNSSTHLAGMITFNHKITSFSGLTQTTFVFVLV